MMTFFDPARHVVIPAMIESGQSPAWSPDSKWVVCAVGTYPNSSLFVARPNGSGRRLLIRNGQLPTWSPDGKRIAFVRVLSETSSEIFVVDRDGSYIRQLTQNKGRAFNPDWRPNR